MDRFYLHVRALTIVTCAVTAGACSDRVATVDDEILTRPACMWIIGTDGHWSDGSLRVIYDESRGRAGTACLCLTEEEFESKTHHDQLNDLALVECERLASVHQFDWDECQQDHEAGAWLGDVFWAAGFYANGLPSGFVCE
jgi:hypothetical protein